MKFYYTFIFLILYVAIQAQNGYSAPQAVGAPLQGGRIMDMNITSRAIDVSRFSGIAGTPFLSVDYKQAFVKTKTGEQFSNAWIKFSTYSNEILLENASQLVALTNVDSVSYVEQSDNHEKANIILKTGYPGIENKTPETIYQILAYRGDLQLLKYYQTKVELVKKMGMPDQKTFVTTPIYYIYRSGSNSIKRVKLNKGLLGELKDFPEASKKASDLSTNFREEKEVIRLLSSI
ncbi:hypothetical protein U0035_16405 [Niabella yanshanensis]|uniref:DUF4369 domain-containing protein n=1 Tax=Niabella yanshanensis TaxID=577386 RepID=A0ABZ0W209_9BACT|nr:hypothetical protein [Niabella yanshanensis]WQD37252.1 hypothetical protein U0035_16405 [Niabella yanshanensis]